MGSDCSGRGTAPYEALGQYLCLHVLLGDIVDVLSTVLVNATPLKFGLIMLIQPRSWQSM